MFLMGRCSSLPDVTGFVSLFEANSQRTCNDGTGSKKDKVDGNHLCGVEHLHCLVEKSVGREERKKRTSS